MKNNRIIEEISNIDDDLICEAAKQPINVMKGGESNMKNNNDNHNEGIIDISLQKNKKFSKLTMFSTAAAAIVVIAVSAFFVLNRNPKDTASNVSPKPVSTSTPTADSDTTKKGEHIKTYNIERKDNNFDFDLSFEDDLDGDGKTDKVEFKMVYDVRTSDDSNKELKGVTTKTTSRVLINGKDYHGIVLCGTISSLIDSVSVIDCGTKNKIIAITSAQEKHKSALLSLYNPAIGLFTYDNGVMTLLDSGFGKLSDFKFDGDATFTGKDITVDAFEESNENNNMQFDYELRDNKLVFAKEYEGTMTYEGLTIPYKFTKETQTKFYRNFNIAKNGLTLKSEPSSSTSDVKFAKDNLVLDADNGDNYYRFSSTDGKTGWVKLANISTDIGLLFDYVTIDSLNNLNKEQKIEELKKIFYFE